MIYLSTFLISFILTYLYREVAKKRSLLAHINSRSSHTIPTVTGGGVAFVISFYVALIYLYFNDMVDNSLFFALLSGVLLAITGFIDDLKELSIEIRLASQIISVLLAFYFLDIFDKYSIAVLLFIYVASIWLINLYNFLDGIDGYAASEAIFALFGAYLIYHNQLFLILIFSIGGFLIFNWHKASIFMGDTGSTFLGFIFVVFILNHLDTISDFIIWYILLGLFIFDATYTIIRRLINRENFSQAHKKHLFQRLNQMGNSHSRVVLCAMGLNLISLIVLLLFKDSIFLYFIFIGYNILLFMIARYIDKKRSFNE